LEIIDSSNPAAPALLGRWYGIGWGQDVAIAGTRAYVAAEQYGVFVLDVSVPATPTLVAQVETPGLARSIALQENLVYVGLDDGGLGVLSLVQPTSVSITPAGGSLATPDGAIAYTFPAGAFTSTVAITLTPRLDGQVPAGGMLRGVGRAFEIEAAYAATGLPAQPALPYTVVVRCDPSRLGPVIESTLDIYRWDVGLGRWISATGTLNRATHTITAHPGRFSYWSVMGQSRRVFAPIMRK
jgi:hypothetical protein